MKKLIETIWIDYADKTGLHERQLPVELRESDDVRGSVNTAAFVFGEPALALDHSAFQIGPRKKMAFALGLSESSFKRWWSTGSLSWIPRYDNLFCASVNSLGAARISIEAARYSPDSMRARSADTPRNARGRFDKPKG